MKKRNQKIHECQTLNNKILCGNFAKKLSTNFAVGDQQNNLLIYNNLDNKPLAILNPQTSNTSSLTSVAFNKSDTQIITGSSRGSINVWDLSTSKIGYCLKGHTIEVSCLLADKSNQNVLMSGSLDTNTKIWDLRSKNCIYTLKNHRNKVSALNFSTDSRILTSGGDDGTVQTWDFRVQKIINQYQINSPILSLDSNSFNILAVGSVDRLARLFYMNFPFDLIGQTKNETMPIKSCIFYQDKYLFTAGTDNLKVWKIDQGQNLIMTDNIQTSSKGILGMIVGEKVQQIAYSNATLTYHECFLNQISFQNKKQSEKLVTINSPSFSISQNDFSQNQAHRKTKSNNMFALRRGTSLNNKSIQSYLTNQKAQQLVSKRNLNLGKHLMGVNQDINDVLNNIKKITNNKLVQNQQIRALEELMDQQHNKFLKVMSNRSKSVQNVMESWSKANTKSVINSVKNIDIYAAADILSQIVMQNKYQISSEFGLTIIQRSKQMIFGKQMSLIKRGLEFVLYVIRLFKDQMIKLKIFGCDKGVDLARQERLKRFDLLIEQYIQIFQSSRLKKLKQKQKEKPILNQQRLEIIKLSEMLYNQLELILVKIYGDKTNGNKVTDGNNVINVNNVTNVNKVN